MTTKINLEAPLWDIGDVVYLRESAAIGFLEAYTVKRPVYQLTGVITYELITHPRPESSAVQTYGDRITNQRTLPLAIPETALCDYCTALDLVIANLQLQLTDAQRMRDVAACPEAEGTWQAS